MKKRLLLSGVIVLITGVQLNAQNVKIQSNKNKTQVKIKETPAPVTNVQIKSNPGGTQIKIHSNPSGTKVQIKEHPTKGRKK